MTGSFVGRKIEWSEVANIVAAVGGLGAAIEQAD